jgi:hypothetical protein
MAHRPDLVPWNGTVVHDRGGEPTGELPGKLVRGAQPRRS